MDAMGRRSGPLVCVGLRACQLNSRSDLSIRRVWNAHDGGALMLLAQLTWESGVSPRRETRRLLIHPPSTLDFLGMACSPGCTVLIRAEHQRPVRGRARVEIRIASAGRPIKKHRMPRLTWRRSAPDGMPFVPGDRPCRRRAGARRHAHSFPPKGSKKQPDNARRLNASRGRCLTGFCSDWTWLSWVSVSDWSRLHDAGAGDP